MNDSTLSIIEWTQQASLLIIKSIENEWRPRRSAFQSRYILYMKLNSRWAHVDELPWVPSIDESVCATGSAEYRRSQDKVRDTFLSKKEVLIEEPIVYSATASFGRTWRCAVGVRSPVTRITGCWCFRNSYLSVEDGGNAAMTLLCLTALTTHAKHELFCNGVDKLVSGSSPYLHLSIGKPPFLPDTRT